MAATSFILEPPCGIIWNRMKAGKAVPFLGAGASIASRTPGQAWDPVKKSVGKVALLASLAGMGVCRYQDCSGWGDVKFSRSERVALMLFCTA
jgi:hypothetical protein